MRATGRPLSAAIGRTQLINNSHRLGRNHVSARVTRRGLHRPGSCADGPPQFTLSRRFLWALRRHIRCRVLERRQIADTANPAHVPVFKASDSLLRPKPPPSAAGSIIWTDDLGPASTLEELQLGLDDLVVRARLRLGLVLRRTRWRDTPWPSPAFPPDSGNCRRLTSMAARAAIECDGNAGLAPHCTQPPS